ncbi:MAG: hypothetical protein A2W98_14410 [Bacteroidetes bacterium GWF2_33_38]|nr:MAG: hypothetical protein A2W98_14410 [Bacteroidetes bacterium GWF2_33_38]
MKNWVLIHTFAQNYLAVIAKEVLEDNNIDANIFSRIDSSYSHLSEFEIYVKPEDESNAKELISKIEN